MTSLNQINQDFFYSLTDFEIVHMSHLYKVDYNYIFQLIIFGKKGSSAEECATATQNALPAVRQDYLFAEMDAVSINHG